MKKLLPHQSLDKVATFPIKSSFEGTREEQDASRNAHIRSILEDIIDAIELRIDDEEEFEYDMSQHKTAWKNQFHKSALQFLSRVEKI